MENILAPYGLRKGVFTNGRIDVPGCAPQPTYKENQPSTASGIYTVLAKSSKHKETKEHLHEVLQAWFDREFNVQTVASALTRNPDVFFQMDEMEAAKPFWRLKGIHELPHKRGSGGFHTTQKGKAEAEAKAESASASASAEDEDTASAVGQASFSRDCIPPRTRGGMSSQHGTRTRATADKSLEESLSEKRPAEDDQSEGQEKNKRQRTFAWRSSPDPDPVSDKGKVKAPVSRPDLTGEREVLDVAGPSARKVAKSKKAAEVPVDGRSGPAPRRPNWGPSMSEMYPYTLGLDVIRGRYACDMSSGRCVCPRCEAERKGR
ncbi:hypothetical protein EG329_009511 [Mollisiaceae sp. DMI_Dod_QoI]|nr:hypothetical protein EG329_009511 [Helotiales sp. DMI_Dod_QoI]